VTSTADSGAGSLRDVLAAAAANEVITFAAALDGATITLTSGPLEVSGRSVTLDASGLSGGVKLSGNNASRVLTITAEADVTLKKLHIRGGREIANKGGGLLVAESALRMEDCSIEGCEALSDGGGIWLNSVTGSITRCRISGNSAGNFGGGLFIIGASALTVSSSQVSGNASATGGGFYIISASPVLVGCTIQGNSGSGVATQTFAAPALRNSILWDNRGGGGTTLAAQQLRNIRVFNPVINTDPAPAVDSCLIEGATDANSFADANLTTWGSGNLNGTTSQPRFISAPAASSAPGSNANLRLRSTSDALNAGSNALTSDLTDLARRPRIQATTVDLGAFEGAYVSFALLHPGMDPNGDQNGNGLNNLAEYAMGRDPAAPHTHPGLPGITRNGNSWTLALSERTNAADIVTTWCSSPDCATWTPLRPTTDFLIISSTQTGTRNDFLLDLDGAQPRRFFKQIFSTGN
jgi:hypothetical protein